MTLVDHGQGDRLAVAFESHRRELHLHCYRMTGSLTDAEDLTQDVFLRAWRAFDRFDDRVSIRTWLYRITTNACIDYLRSHQRRAQPTASVPETLEREGWIDPYPDVGDPAEVVVRRESTSLHLIAALAHLPPRQRAAVIARDLLDFDARATAEILESTPVAVNSLLQRARHRLRELGVPHDDRPDTDPDDENVIRAYVDAHDRGDVATIVSLLAQDVRITMPPEAPCTGIDEAERFFEHLLGPDGPGEWELAVTQANNTFAIINSIRRPGTSVSRPLSIDLLHLADGRINAIHCFIGPHQVRAFIDRAGAHPQLPTERRAVDRAGLPPESPRRGRSRGRMGP